MPSRENLEMPLPKNEEGVSLKFPGFLSFSDIYRNLNKKKICNHDVRCNSCLKDGMIYYTDMNFISNSMKLMSVVDL